MRTKPTQPKRIGRSLQTVVLRHETKRDAHFDWLLEDPRAEAESGKLATFRAATPPATWSVRHPLIVERLADHRRVYLHYQGPISDGRGWVRRVDTGHAVVHRATEAWIDLTLNTMQYRGRLRLSHVSGPVWRIATLEG